MRHFFRPLFPVLLLTLLPITPAAAQSMGGNGLDAYGYDSGGTYHGSNYGSSPNYMITGPSDADTAALQAKLENDFAFLNRHNDPPPRHSWSDDNDYTPPPPPPPHVPSFMERMQAKADAGDKDALRFLADDIVLWDRGDYARAVTLYQKAIDAGDQTSMEPLYHLLLDPKRGVVDVARAAKMLPALSDQDFDLQDTYGRALIAGDDFPKDAVHGLGLREAAATTEHSLDGSLHVMYDLARDYDTGNGIARNPERALRWYTGVMWTFGWEDKRRADAATRACALMLAQKDSLRVHRDDFVSLLTSFSSALPWSEREKLTTDIAKSLAPGEQAPANPATGAGLLLMTKSFGTPDYAAAIKHFTGNDDVPPENHPNDDLVALHQLALIYENGLGVPRDHDKAMEFFEKVKDNYGDACYYRAVDFLNKWRVYNATPGHSSEAFAAANDSNVAAAAGAKLGDIRSKVLSGEWIQHEAENASEFTPEDKMVEFQNARKLWKEASDAGSVRATYLLGMAAETGAGTPKDLVAAAKFYRQASDAGDASAQHRYAAMMVLGQGGVPKDAAGGQALLAKAAASEPEAANQLAVLLWHGPDPKSHGAAIKKWLQKSFDDGYWVAGRNLAKYYHVGLGGTKDESQARDYLEKAAARGGKDSAKMAMDAYTKGDCVSIDPAAAARWKAAAGL